MPDVEVDDWVALWSEVNLLVGEVEGAGVKRRVLLYLSGEGGENEAERMLVEKFLSVVGLVWLGYVNFGE